MAFTDHPTRTVRTNGQRIHLHIAGTIGPLILFCHGFPESSYSWRHQLDALSEAGYRAVAMDMRGYGRSSKPADLAAYSISRLVEDCVGVVEALGDSTAVIVGHDFGAPVAWTAAWTRPDVFSAVVGISLPFAARGFAALPGDPFGKVRPSKVHLDLAGPDLVFYQDYFAHPGHVAEQEIEEDLRSWLTGGLYSLSADRPMPSELAAVDLLSLPYESVVEFVRASMCIPKGEKFAVRMEVPDELPGWLSQDDLDYLVAELEHSGMRAPLAYYNNIDLAWEELERFDGRPLTVPALFIGGDRDVGTIWSQEAAARSHELVEDLRGSVIVPNCGHWIQQEHPEAVNREILAFLEGL
ncbi:alpha/beta fold hydrolase [Actinoallomurus sp. CA-150999]|uniref:alpha/beta fold hydrolase n=1 Tax=Actinoallomurus sp. CA-150999 TaxID=3239887 RepID=UPI003D8B0A4F